jgi:hypothetical protein
MSCYFRHMKDVFEEIGVETTPENKRTIDAAIHKIVKVEYKQCADTWKKIKEEIRTDPKKRDRFVAKVRKAVGS